MDDGSIITLTLQSLFFFDFLVFFVVSLFFFRFSLLSCVFSCLFRDFGVREQKPLLFSGFPLLVFFFFQKKKARVGGSG